jgi:peptide deformylase
VGESLRIFVTCALYGEPERVFINPRLELSGAITGGDEGCLSLPEIRAEIMRPPQARITALDLEGNEFTMERDGIWARVWQHEYDHLEGTLIIDRMRPLDRLANRRAIRDLERAVDGGRGR